MLYYLGTLVLFYDVSSNILEEEISRVLSSLSQVFMSSKLKNNYQVIRCGSKEVLPNTY